MKKIIFISTGLFLFLIIGYFSTISLSLNRFHKAIYNNDEILIKYTINFTELKKNIKENFNSIMLDEMNKDKGSNLSINILAAGIASKFSDFIIDTYATPKGISILIKEINIRNLPKPSLLDSYAFIRKLEFVNLDHFYFFYEKEENKIPIHFKRNGINWQLTDFKIKELKKKDQYEKYLEENPPEVKPK